MYLLVSMIVARGPECIGTVIRKGLPSPRGFSSSVDGTSFVTIRHAVRHGKAKEEIVISVSRVGEVATIKAHSAAIRPMSNVKTIRSIRKKFGWLIVEDILI